MCGAARPARGRGGRGKKENVPNPPTHPNPPKPTLSPSQPQYALATAFHSANIVLADARKAGNAAAIQAAETAVVSAQAAVTQALQDGRVLSAAHILDLPMDCVAYIFQLLAGGNEMDEDDADTMAHVCRDWKAAATHVPVCVDVTMSQLDEESKRATWLAELAERSNVRRIAFTGVHTARDCAFIRAALDAAPGVQRLDVSPKSWEETPSFVDFERALRGARPVELALHKLQRRSLTELSSLASFPIVELDLNCELRALPHLPALRKLKMFLGDDPRPGEPSLTQVAPALESVAVTLYQHDDKQLGSIPFWRALAGVTRLDVKYDDEDMPGMFTRGGRGGVDASGLAAAASTLQVLSLETIPHSPARSVWRRLVPVRWWRHPRARGRHPGPPADAVRRHPPHRPQRGAVRHADCPQSARAVRAGPARRQALH